MGFVDLTAKSNRMTERLDMLSFGLAGAVALDIHRKSQLVRSGYVKEREGG
jgi:hypothetical protein